MVARFPSGGNRDLRFDKSLIARAKKAKIVFDFQKGLRAGSKCDYVAALPAEFAAPSLSTFNRIAKMSHIHQIDYASASDAVRAEHDREFALRGRMTNMKRTLLHSPVAHRIYAEWFTLRAELDPAISDREIWIFSHAISKAAKSKIAITFFRRALINARFNPDALEDRRAHV